MAPMAGITGHEIHIEIDVFWCIGGKWAIQKAPIRGGKSGYDN